MRLGIRGKLFVGALLVITVAVLAGGSYLEPTLRAWLEARVEEELTRGARTALVAVETRPRLGSEADRLADRLGRSMNVRVTIIAADGRVLGDSELSRRQVAAVENHGHRPEVRQARAGGLGLNRRYSTTLDTQMLYVAVSYHRPDGAGTLRVATPLSEVDHAVSRLRVVLLIAALVGLGVAVLLGGWASHLWSRPVRRLVGHARAIARGERPGKLAVSSRDELGRLAGSFNQMVEELQRRVSDLAAERDRFEAVLEGMSEGVVALDHARRITHVNRRAVELLGLERAPTGRALVEAVRVPALTELVEAAGSEPASAELDLQRGQLRVLATARAQQAGGVILVLHDLTELRRLRTVRQDLVANVSHELRTPVSVILANAETLLGGALDDREQARRFVEALQRNAARLSTLISDLLDLSRIDAGHYPLEPEPVELAAVARQALAVVAAEAERRELQVEPAIDAELRARADPDALQQVLVNLLDNAVKYTPAGGHVRLTARQGEGAVRLEVADDGPGIPPKHRERLFERFYRVDKGRSRQAGGTGLGLSIVKNLVEAMEGRVGYAPAAPRGSIFWIELPGVHPRPAGRRCFHDRRPAVT